MQLSVNNLTAGYNQVTVLKEISISVSEKEMVAVIGANGAGKTTLMKCISGLLAPRGGEIWYGDKRIDGLPPHEIVGLGISQVPERRGIFDNMTVLHNLYMGAFLRNDKKEVKEDLTRIFNMFPKLEERQKQNAGSLSGGEQQMLSIARSLMSRPRVLLLDEPSLGLSPLIISEVADIIYKINQQEEVAIITVEQNAELALKLSRKGYVLENGIIVQSGSSDELLESTDVKKAYLGI